VLVQLQEENRHLRDELHALRCQPTVEPAASGTSLKDSKWSFPDGLDPIAKRKARGLRGPSRSRKEAGWGVSGVPDIMFFF